MNCLGIFLLVVLTGVLVNSCQDVQEKDVEGALDQPAKVKEKESKPVAPPQPVDLDTDPALMGWWKFEETAGTVAADSSPYGRKGELKEGLTFEKDSVAGKVGKALRFDGKNDVVQITKYKGVTGTKARTLAAWIKTKRGRGEIMSWGADDAGTMWIFGFIRSRPGVTPNGGYFYMKPHVNDDKWHHVAVVVAEADLPNLHDHVTLYLNGEQAELDDIGLLDLWPIETGAEIDVRIGRGIQGAIDEVRIYERALSADEIRKIKNAK